MKVTADVVRWHIIAEDRSPIKVKGVMMAETEEMVVSWVDTQLLIGPAEVQLKQVTMLTFTTNYVQ